MDYQIFPPEELAPVAIRLPLSKSISNRVLLINALTGGKGTIKEVADCDDTNAMKQALASTADTINIGAAGTAMRFLTAYFAALDGRTVTLDGTDRMRQRPIKLLVDALRACGASIEYAGEEGFPPLKITGRKLRGGEVSLDASVSSQYISALLMVAPAMTDGLTLNLTGDQVSTPYVNMTIALMKQWGVEAETEGRSITVKAAEYKPIEFTVEADWSAASYWYEIAAFSFADIKLLGLDRDSIQGDAVVSEIYKQFGIVCEWDAEGALELSASPDLTPRFRYDLTDSPDLAQTLTVTCCALNLPFQMTGLSTLKIKETDRLKALCTELGKVSFFIQQPVPGVLEWEGERMPVQNAPVAIDTWQDHRMAMAFAPLGLFLPGLIIKDADVVSKSYPDFWQHLRDAGFTLEEIDLTKIEDVDSKPATEQ